MDGGHRGKAEVHGAAVHLDLDATILGNPAFGNVKVGHDLQPGNHRRVHFDRGRHEFVKKPVDPGPDPESTCLGLEMDVAGPFPDRLEQDNIGQVYHRAALSHFGDFADGFFLTGLHHLDAHCVEVGHDLGHVHLRPVTFIDHVEDVVGPANNGLYLHVGDPGHLFKDKRCRGIARGQGQLAPHTEEGNYLILEGLILGEHVHDSRINHSLAEPGVGDTELVSEDLIELLPGHDLLFNKNLPERLPALLLEVKHFRQFIRADPSLIYQDFAEFLPYRYAAFFHEGSLMASGTLA